MTTQQRIFYGGAPQAFWFEGWEGSTEPRNLGVFLDAEDRWIGTYDFQRGEDGFTRELFGPLFGKTTLGVMRDSVEKRGETL